MFDERNLFGQPMKNDITYENIRNIATGQDDYLNGWLIDYPYFKENYKLIVIDLNKKQALDTNPNAVSQITFTGHCSDVSRLFLGKPFQQRISGQDPKRT